MEKTKEKKSTKSVAKKYIYEYTYDMKTDTLKMRNIPYMLYDRNTYFVLANGMRLNFYDVYNLAVPTVGMLRSIDGRSEISYLEDNDNIQLFGYSSTRFKKEQVLKVARTKCVNMLKRILITYKSDLSNAQREVVHNTERITYVNNLLAKYAKA